MNAPADRRRATGDDIRALEPRLIPRECGGWLAISGRDAPINFREAFAESREAWAKLRDLP